MTARVGAKARADMMQSAQVGEIVRETIARYLEQESARRTRVSAALELHAGLLATTCIMAIELS